MALNCPTNVLLRCPYVCSKNIFRHKYRQYRADENQRSVKTLDKLLGTYEKSKQQILHPTSVVVAKGAPKFLTETRGHSKTIYRRQIVLNKHFMECITDVLLTESIGNDLQKYGVHITQVEVDIHYNYLNVFWIAPNQDILEVGRQLNMMTGKLHKAIIEKNFMGRVPTVKFNHDQTTSTVSTVQTKLKEADYGKNFKPSDPTKFAPPTQVATGKPKVELLTTYFKKRVAVFNAEQARLNSMAADSSGYKVPTFQCPADMNLNILGIEYLKIMNKVLFTAKRSRAEHRGFNPVADPLPPAEWISPPIFPPDEPENLSVESSPKYRMDVMKRFMVDNKKKRERMSRQARREADEQLVSISEHLEGAKSRLYSDYEYQENQESFGDHDYDDSEEPEK
ncbi:hypothetical protein HDE_05198 [Halotydeus destructor]|nr:hypothetical protein HDE_05198 [Halotydeus destructor]